MAVSIKSLNGLGAIGKLGIDQTLVELAVGRALRDQADLEGVRLLPGRLGRPAAGGDGAGVARPAAEAEWRHAAAKRQVWIGEDDDEHTGEIAINCRQRDAAEAAGGRRSTGAEAAMERPKASRRRSAKRSPLSQQPAPAPSGWPVFDAKTMFTAPLTKLRDATQLYQPVSGTSGGSRYFMVAANQDLRIGARLHGGTLSVRIEGPGWKKHVTGIKAVGFEKIDRTRTTPACT